MPHPLSSQTISALRFPLAVMVVFIHSFMLDDVAFTPDWHALSGMDFAIGLQVLLSKVVSHVAVPAFYVISGYLFSCTLSISPPMSMWESCAKGHAPSWCLTCCGT